jgi:tetratricopeptide (TPR) repeat protein
MSLRSIQLRQRQLVEEAIRTQLDLLRQTEQRRDVAPSPTDRERYNLQIRELKFLVEQSKAELQELEDEMKAAEEAPAPLRLENYRVRLSGSLTEEQLNSEFQREVQELLELMEYELGDDVIAGAGPTTPPTFVARHEGDFKALKTIFHCLYGIIEEKAVIDFNGIYTLNRQAFGLNFAVIITNTYIAPAARLLARQYQIQLLSFEDMLNAVIKPDKYLKGKCRDYEQDDILFHTYVELRYLRRGNGRFKEHKATSQEFLVTEAMDGSSFEAKGDLTPYVDTWLHKDGNSQLCLLGEYGTGKTSFATQYFYKRALAYMDNPLKNRIPLLVTLNRYHKSADIEQLMTDFLVNECGVRRNFKTFLRLAARGKLLIILDGFDEMAKQVNVNVRRHNFKEISKLAVGLNKIILSGRPNYFLTRAEINEIFSQESERTDLYQAAIKQATASHDRRYEILNITLFDRWQIEEFLKRQSEYLKGKGIEDWRDLRKIIYDTYNLEELARTPVLLDIIIKTIPEIRGKVTHINAAKLYQIYTDFWLNREYDEKGDVRWLITRKEKELFVSELAWTMLMIDSLRPEIHFSQLSERVRSYFNLERASEIEYFSSDIRFCSYLIHSASDGNYKFIHKSFMEYFSARYIYHALFREKNLSRIITDRPITEEVFFFLSQMVGLDEIDLMRGFSGAQEDEQGKEFLVGLTTRVLQQSVRFYEHRGALQSAEEWTNKLLAYSEEVDSDEGRLWGLISLGKLKAQLSLYEEAEGCYDRALTISTRLGDKSSEGEVLSEIGAIHQRRGEYGEALRCHTHAISLFEEVGDKASTGRALASVGAIHQHRGEYGEALRCYTDAIKLFEESSDRASMGQALASVGTLHRNVGEYNSSLEYYQRALAIFRELADRRSESQAIAQLGHMYQESGRYEEAEGFFREELNISKELEDQQGVSRALSNMGYLCRMTNRYADAEEWYRRSLDISEQLGDKQGVSEALYAIGNLYQYEKRFDEAEILYRRSVSILEELRDTRGLGMNFYQIANVYAGRGRFPESGTYYDRALEIFAGLGDRRGISSVIHRLGVVAQNNGDFEQAEKYYRESLHIKEQVNDAVGVQELMESLGGLEEARQNFGEAERLYLSALSDAQKIGNRGNACDLHAKLGRLAKKVGDSQKAIDHYASYLRLSKEMNLPPLEDIVQEYEQLISMNKQNPFLVGSPVNSEGLFGGRKAVLEAIHGYIQQQTNVMLIGERRMGKTSLLIQLRESLKPPLIPVLIDLEAFPTQAEGMLGGILRKTINELLSQNLLSSEQWEQYSITYRHDFIEALESILDEAKVKLKNIKIILMLDEAEMLFTSGYEVGGVLRAALMRNHDVMAVIAGTSRIISLSSTTPTSPLYTIFRVINLPPLSEEETKSLLKELSLQAEVEYMPSALDRVYALSGGVPYYAQVLGFELVELARRESKSKIAVEDVNKIVSEVLSSFQANFQHTWLYELNEQERTTIVELIDNHQERINRKSLYDLQTRQLIIEENGRYRLIAGLFEEWLRIYIHVS